jgi:small-conductance mechanosensitive channel
MYFVLFLLIIALLCSSKDRALERLGHELLSGVLCAVLLVAVLMALVFGLTFFPTVTKLLLCTGAAVASALLVRWIYRRFFSPEARLKAAYNTMHKRWYALSWQVVQLEKHRNDQDYLSWALKDGERILQRCRQEHERYKKLPPEPEPWRAKFYTDDILRLESRMLAVAQGTVKPE